MNTTSVEKIQVNNSWVPTRKITITKTEDDTTATVALLDGKSEEGLKVGASGTPVFLEGGLFKEVDTASLQKTIIGTNSDLEIQDDSLKVVVLADSGQQRAGIVVPEDTPEFTPEFTPDVTYTKGIAKINHATNADDAQTLAFHSINTEQKVAEGDNKADIALYKPATAEAMGLIKSGGDITVDDVDGSTVVNHAVNADFAKEATQANALKWPYETDKSNIDFTWTPKETEGLVQRGTTTPMEDANLNPRAFFYIQD